MLLHTLAVGAGNSECRFCLPGMAKCQMICTAVHLYDYNDTLYHCSYTILLLYYIIVIIRL